MADSSKPLSERARDGRGCLVAFFLLFFVVGAGFFAFAFLLPVARSFLARNWTPTPCVILSSRVDESRSSKGSTTTRPEIRYRYTYAGRQFESDRFDPLSVRTNDRRYASEAVRRFRPRQHATCYVNPDKPSEAMLSRDLPSTFLLITSVIPLVFMAIGAGGAWFTWRAKRPSATPLGAVGLPTAKPATHQVLKPRQSPRARLIVMVIFALFWNGIISFLVVHVVQSHQRGRADWCMTAFSVPFVAVGIGLLIGVVYALLALFNPQPEVTLARAPLRPGESTDVKWRFTGRYDHISRLKIHMEGREEATYRRGTDNVTDKSIFFRQDVVVTMKNFDIQRGGGKITLPPQTMHTFSAPNNKIVWELHVHGEITGWPDVTEQFEIIVLPAEVKR